jgi:hypothetical protein
MVWMNRVKWSRLIKELVIFFFFFFFFTKKKRVASNSLLAIFDTIREFDTNST